MGILLRAASRTSHLEDCCRYIRINSYIPEVIEQLVSTQWKVDGSICVLVRHGEVKLQVNTEETVLRAPTAMSLPHASVVQFIGCSQDIDVYLLSYTPSFLHEVNISFSSISGEAIMGRDDRTLPLSSEEADYILRYFDLIYTVMDNYLNLPMARHTVSSLTSALFYQMVDALYARVEIPTSGSKTPQRQLTYVHDFIKLVHMHFGKERTVSFYADKLFISPKYLSLLVKEATGRSAAQWIDHHVIIEAKNLLRYSGKNIQQVAYALNFSNQSSFGKYFKHLTGMSPTEYQKS